MLAARRTQPMRAAHRLSRRIGEPFRVSQSEPRPAGAEELSGQESHAARGLQPESDSSVYTRRVPAAATDTPTQADSDLWTVDRSPALRCAWLSWSMA